jgi:hypothetical protein
MSGFRVSFTSRKPAGIVGKLFSTLFFLVFLCMGSFFVWLVAREAVARLETLAWKTTRCEIIASSVGETDQAGQRTGDFYFSVTYRYTFGGQTYTSDKYQRKPESSSDYGKVAGLTERYHAGSTATCFVNPSNPAEAILERGNLVFFPLVVLFPMIFVAIGGGGIYFTWRRKSPIQGSAQPISERAVAGKGQWVLVIFFLVFFVMGSVFLYGVFLRPAWKMLNARAWPAVPCVVIASEVKSHSDSDGTTYSVNIFYSYVFQDREHKANQYHFMGGSSSGYEGKRAVVARYPPGAKAVCYVNPRQPTEAVLNRGFTTDLWFGLIPLVFVGVGAGGLVFTVRKWRQGGLAIGPKSFSRGGSRAGSVPFAPPGGSLEPLLLRPKTSPIGKVLGTLFITLFWNGIVSVFVAEVVRGWRSGHPEWFLTLFLIPFVVIGLGLVGMFFYSLLALANPRPRLRITPDGVRLGESLRVEWEFTGRTEVLQNLRLRLQGREEATYRRGTSTATDKSVFADLELADVTAAPEIRSGTRTVTVPADLMHTFTSQNNKIIWTLRLNGQIARWPDVNEEFPVTVLPAAKK